MLVSFFFFFFLTLDELEFRRGGQTTCFSLRYSFSVLGPAPGPICAWEPSRLADRRGGDIGTGGHWGAVRRDSSGDEKLLDEEVK
ncbi:hypothetical protein BKA81DRAFT_364192 [Phyllosticta paracitricarpa]